MRTRGIGPGGSPAGSERVKGEMSVLESPEMTTQSDLVKDLQTLNEISLTLNQSADVQTALDESLAQLVGLMGLETGWIFVVDPLAVDRWGGRGFRLAAHHNLPPALDENSSDAWDKSCDCQALCLAGQMVGAYNEVRCSRLASVMGDRNQLAVHASTPLRSGDRILGILNVAAPSWSYFTERNLAFLSLVGNQMGTALERARLYDSLQMQRIHEQAVLLELSQQLLLRHDLGDLLDFIVEEVRAQLDADACAVLLPGSDPDHLYFRAASGWHSDPVGNAYRAPADNSTGSGQVMRTQQVLLIEDLQRQDPPLWTSEWLDREAFRAVAIVPLMAEDRSIGTLLIDSREPRRFTEDEVRFLRLMANQVALALEKARLQQDQLERERIEEELAVARQIQVSMLPAAPPQRQGWQFATHFEAAHQVGGDFYDFLTLPGEEGRWGVVIADVSDKGVPSALFMALSLTTIRNIALRGRSPGEVLSWANRYIQEDSQSDMFLSVFYAELNSYTGQLTYVNAGHNPPLLWRAAEGEFHRLPANSPLLGVLPAIDVQARTIDMAVGDILVLYTDGLSEAHNHKYEEFGVDRLEETVRRLLAHSPNAGADEICVTLAREVRKFAGDTEQFDDMTMVIIKRSEEFYGNA